MSSEVKVCFFNFHLRETLHSTPINRKCTYFEIKYSSQRSSRDETELETQRGGKKGKQIV